jgi:hypothetical protein
MMRYRVLSVAGMAVLGTSALTDRADARIVCDGAYQIVQGQPVSTPYCQDAYLAVVVREYGMRTSAAAIRNNPSVKAQACRLAGQDNRVQTACAAYRPGDSRRRF